MASEESRQLDLERHMRAGDVDSVTEMLRQHPNMIRFISGGDIQKYLVTDPEMRDFLSEIATVNRAAGQVAGTSQVRTGDLAKRLGVPTAVTPRWLSQSRAQADLEGAAARGRAAADFERRRNDPLRNAPVEAVTGAAAEGWGKQSGVAAGVGGAVGIGLATAGLIASVIGSAFTMGATVPAAVAAGASMAAAPLATAGGIVGGAAGLGSKVSELEVQRKTGDIVGQAAVARRDEPSYASIYQQPAPLEREPASFSFEDDRTERDPSGYLWG